jgi:hypothetical protein
MDELKAQVASLDGKGSVVTSISDGAISQIRRLMNVEQDVRDKIAQSRILRALQFDEMSNRQESVGDANAKTLEWIFMPLTDGQESEAEGAASRADAKTNGSNDEALVSDKRKDGSGAARSPSDQEEEMRRIAREKLDRWLSSGGGIFHVSGKLGAGKSTVMKYLSNHDETRKRLLEWAGKPPVGQHRDSPTDAWAR